MRKDQPVNERGVRHGPNGAALKIGMTPAKRIAGTRHRYRPGPYGLISQLVYLVLYHIPRKNSIVFLYFCVFSNLFTFKYKKRGVGEADEKGGRPPVNPRKLEKLVFGEPRVI